MKGAPEGLDFAEEKDRDWGGKGMLGVGVGHSHAG